MGNGTEILKYLEISTALAGTVKSSWHKYKCELGCLSVVMIEGTICDLNVFIPEFSKLLFLSTLHSLARSG